MAIHPVNGGENDNMSADTAPSLAEIEMRLAVPYAATLEPDAATRLARRRALGLGALASLLAFIGRSAARAADALTIAANGDVRLAGALRIAGKNVLELGVGAKHKVKQDGQEIEVDKQGQAGWIVYGAWEDALDIVGAGADIPSRKIKLFAEGGTSVSGPLDVDGTVKAQAFETATGDSFAKVRSTLTTLQNAFQSSLNNVVPIGTILLFAGDPMRVNELTKQGWLPCGAGAVSETEYPDLAKAIGDRLNKARPGYFWIPTPENRLELNLNQFHLTWIIKAKLVPVP